MPMRRSIFILSSLLCVCGIQYAGASDYLEEEPIETPVVEDLPPDNIVVSDDEYARNSVDELVEVRAQVDELLIPVKTQHNLWTDDSVISDDCDESVQAVIMTPANNKKHFKHKKPAVPVKTDMTLGEQNYYGETVYIINNFLYGTGDNVSETDGAYSAAKMNSDYSTCPFKTQSECAIWFRKPLVSETVSPRSRTLRDSVMCEIESAIESNPNVSANDKAMAPLLNRYRVLMRASQSCCTGGITYKLQKAGASQKLVYKFLADDANFSGFGSRCLVMNDDEINDTKKYTATSATIADVRNGCLCKSKTTFKALLTPFAQLYKDYPEFASAPFEYKHYDGVGRTVTDSINADVQNVLNQLEMCP